MQCSAFLLRVFLTSFGKWGEGVLTENAPLFKRLYGEAFSAQEKEPFTILLQRINRVVALDGEADPVFPTLTSVFKNVTLFSGKSNEAKKMAMEHQEAKEGFPFPTVLEKYAADKTIAEFQAAVATYFSLCHESTEQKEVPRLAETLLRNLEYFSQKHLWPLAASSETAATDSLTTDIGLCDFLKIKMALAGCLFRIWEANGFRQPEGGEKLRIFAADFSGIQHFIFDLKSIKKAASRLRARSFLVQALMEDVKLEFFREFGASNWDVVAEAGGKFYALLPDLPGVEAKEQALQDKFDSLCCRQFQAEIRIHIGLSAAFSVEELAGQDGADSIFQRGDKVLARKKKQPFAGLLSASESAWRLPEHSLGAQLCPACKKQPAGGRSHPGGTHAAFFRTFRFADDPAANAVASQPPADPAAELEQWCEWCRQDVQVGDALRNGEKYLVFTALDDPDDRYLWVLDRQRHNSLPRSSDKHLLLQYPIKATYVGSHVPETPEFETIAKQATGDRMLGIIKGDIDNLGLLMRCGLPAATAGGKSSGIVPLARALTFSRMLEMFFSGFLPAYLNNHPKYADMYSVFAGGDDFVLIGPWDKAIDFVYDFRRLFADYCDHKPDLHFSAALYFCRYKYPVFRAIRDAENELQQAKDGRLPSADAGRDVEKEIAASKNALRLFGQTIPWQEADLVKSDMEALAEWLAASTSPQSKRGVSYGFVRDLLQFTDMLDKEADNPSMARWRPLLAYQLSRNIKKGNPDESAIREWVRPLLSLTSDKTPAEAARENYLSTIAQYALHWNKTSFFSPGS